MSTDAAERRPLPRWVWVILIASLAANLFVVGVVARSVWPVRYAAAGHGPGGLLGNLMAYSKELPEPRRAVVRQSFDQERPLAGLRPLRQELRAARREAARLFTVDPFNRDEFLAAEARVQAAEVKIRQSVVGFSAELAGRMTAEERAGFLKWRELRRGAAGRGHGQADPDAA
ncbi:MAG: periplasmic heavy metal sensor, partial [Hyphomicrobiaceae bacterium]